MNLVIRESNEDDLQYILALYKQPDMDNNDGLPLQQARQIYLKMKNYPDYKVFIAEADQNIAGTYALCILDNLAHMGTPSAVIEDVVVGTQWQGQGIGKKMMIHAMDYCRSKGCYKVSLSSGLKRIHAHGFYESLGFKRHGYSFLIEF